MNPAWVFHRGALGDSVMLWPMLRAMARAGRTVTLVTDDSKARLAARNLGVTPVDAEQPRWNALWTPDAAVEPVPGVAEVFSAEVARAGSTWTRNAGAAFPGAALRTLPTRPDRPFALDWVQRGGAADPRDNPRGPIVAHVGAGAQNKRWPLERFAALRAGVVGALIAGEVEAERFSPRERGLFRDAQGRWILALDELADVLRSARLVVACDSGPGHLAAQLGIPTLSLFGPTDPRRWAPVGPRTRALSPEQPAGMDWLSVDRVRAESLSMLAPT